MNARTHQEPRCHRFEHLLEDKFQSELNQPWIRSWSGAGYDAEVLVVGCATNCVGRSELCPIENVEELRSKLDVEPVVGGESCSLE